MAKKEKVKRPVSLKEKWFMVINMAVIVGILLFYVYRMFIYKAYFDSLQTNVETDLLITVIVNKMKAHEIEDLTGDDETKVYTFAPNASTNYLVYSGRVFRILKIDSTGNMTAIAENGDAMINQPDKLPFDETRLYEWLNPSEKEHAGIYFEAFDNPASVLVKGVTYSQITDLEQIGQNVHNDPEGYISLLTLEDYENYGGANSFLNTGEDFLLASYNSEGEYWMVNSDGSVSLESNPIYLHNIRPVITINYEIKAISGEGTQEDPYVISEAPAVSEELMIGQYVRYSDKLFVTVQCGQQPRLMLVDAIEELAFSNGNVFSLKSGIGRILNNDFLKSLKDYSDYLVQSDYYCGAFDGEDFNYLASYGDYVKCYVGLPVLGNMGLQYLNDSYLSNYSSINEDIIYSVSSSRALYGDFITELKNAHPVITLRNDLKVASGAGTADDPFILEVSNNEQ